MFVSYLSILIFGPLATDSIKFLEKKLKKITMPNYKKKTKKEKQMPTCVLKGTHFTLQLT